MMTEAKKTESKETEKKTTKESIFKTLQKINVDKYLDKKMGLNYLSWAKAWHLVKQVYPDVKKHITEYPEYLPSKDGWAPTGRTVDYRLTPFGCEVEVTVEIEGNKYTSNLYVMDYKNKAVKDLKRLDFQQINKTQQRCLVKALAYAGLGLNVYAGEDLPEEEPERKSTPKRTYKRKATPVKVSDLSDDQLKKHMVNYDGNDTWIIYIVNAMNNGNKDAEDFAKTLKGRDKEVLDEMKKRNMVA